MDIAMESGLKPPGDHLYPPAGPPVSRISIDQMDRTEPGTVIPSLHQFSIFIRPLTLYRIQEVEVY